MGKTIGILIFDGAEEMDFVGPWEVMTGVRCVRGGILVTAGGVMSGSRYHEQRKQSWQTK